MNRLIETLRGWLERPQPPVALPGFDNRMDVLCRYAQHAADYEDELLSAYHEIEDQLSAFEGQVERALTAGNDRDALEYVRLLVRLRPQRELLDRELRNFHAVAGALVVRVDTLMAHIDEAHLLAESAARNPAATHYLDQTLTRLTRYFVMLERVAAARRQELPDRLAALTLQVLDNRKLDLELATYILHRRRSIGSGG